jgi:hypothetical protein
MRHRDDETGDTLGYFIKPATGFDPVFLLDERAGCQDNGAIPTVFIGHHQRGGKRIHVPVEALDRGIERLQIDG